MEIKFGYKVFISVKGLISPIGLRKFVGYYFMVRRLLSGIQ